MNNTDSLQLSIRKTLTYFDLANFPLTKEELFVFLWQPPQVLYEDFLKFLETSMPASSGFEYKDGYYFLPGRQEIIKRRQESLLISEKKLKIARRAAWLVQSVPFLKAIFVCNTVASEQAGVDSDIDFFIITAKNRIWIVRLMVTFILQLSGLRRRKDKIKDKICLSFYVTEDALDLAQFRVVDDDIHFAFWINQMLPLVDPDNYYAKFLQANTWLQTYLPNINVRSLASNISLVLLGRVGGVWKKVWESMWQGSYGDIINNQAKQMQLSKIKLSGGAIDRNDKGVVISDTVLKFHEKDTRLEYRQQWLDALK